MNTKISTDKKQINTDLLYADLTYKVRGCIFNVYNALGHGHKEQVYQKALEKEFKDQKVTAKREVNLKVLYKDEKVGNYRPDFVVDDKLILELKAVEFIPKSYEQQLIHYLKTTDLSLGMLVNFGKPKLEIKRLVWTRHPRKSV